MKPKASHPHLFHNSAFFIKGNKNTTRYISCDYHINQTIISNSSLY